MDTLYGWVQMFARGVQADMRRWLCRCGACDRKPVDRSILEEMEKIPPRLDRIIELQNRRNPVEQTIRGKRRPRRTQQPRGVER